MVIGVTGGIASGKSTVCKILASKGFVHIDADDVAHDVLDLPDVIGRIAEIFGNDVLYAPEDQRGPLKVDRKALGRIVFADPEKMDMYNREEFVNRIFDTMSGNGAVTIKDFTQEGITSFENLFVRTVGWSEFNSNPVKEIGDSVINDIKESRKVKPIRENIIARKLIRIGVCVACGILAVLLPDYFMVWFFSALLLLVLIFELFQTIKHTWRNYWTS